MAGSDRPDVSITPNGIGQYIDYDASPWSFYFNYFDREIVSGRNWDDQTTQIGPFVEYFETV